MAGCESEESPRRAWRLQKRQDHVCPLEPQRSHLPSPGRGPGHRFRVSDHQDGNEIACCFKSHQEQNESTVPGHTHLSNVTTATWVPSHTHSSDVTTLPCRFPATLCSDVTTAPRGSGGGITELGAKAGWGGSGSLKHKHASSCSEREKLFATHAATGSCEARARNSSNSPRKDRRPDGK